MKNDYVVKTITPPETYPIRQKVLRPTQTIEDCKYPGDLENTSHHLGIFKNELQAGIASIYNQDEHGRASPGIWRIRGMAVLPEFQSHGLGAQLLEGLLSYAKSMRATRIWCNARVTAQGFYTKFGMQSEGKQFNIEPIGPHYVYAIDY